MRLSFFTVQHERDLDKLARIAERRIDIRDAYLVFRSNDF